MEIIMISDNKLKVMLCKEDLSHFELKPEQLDYSNTETKRMFWDVLNRAKHQTGFDTDGQRVLVQLYPSKEGGCEMFVTKIGLLHSDDCSKDKSNSNEKKYSELNNLKKSSNTAFSYSAFRFENTEEMLEVCRRLASIGYIGESSAYFCENGKKYLFLSDVDFSEFAPPDEFSFISEYGELESSKKLIYYLSEHGKAICEHDAVSTLSKL